jgi:menaquinone-dependent protoporphyrinogen oxidase
MKVFVAYASRLGSTEVIARRIAARLRADGLAATAHDLEAPTSPGDYDAFVIGSAVYAGHWLDAANEFAREHSVLLARLPVWLFSSGPLGGTDASRSAVPAEVRGLEVSLRANEHRMFAGAFSRATVDEGEFGVGERFIARRFVPEGDFRDWPAIDSWADEIARELHVTPMIHA